MRILKLNHVVFLYRNCMFVLKSYVVSSLPPFQISLKYQTMNILIMLEELKQLNQLSKEQIIA